MANMFDKIKNHPELSKIKCCNCSENNATVKLCISLKLDVNEEKILILRPDNYYHSKRMHNPPPSPDCLIFVNCDNKENYDLYLIELKDVKDTRTLKYKVIVEKFNTMINRFFVDFDAIFGAVNYGKIKFYLISTYPKNSENISEEEYRKKIKTCLLDTYASQKPLRLYNKAVLIEPKAFLTIMPC
jgi:hypothetical protein